MMDYLAEYTSIVDSATKGMARMIDHFGGRSERVRLYFDQHQRILDSLEERAKADGIETGTKVWCDQHQRVFGLDVKIKTYEFGVK